MLIYVIASTGQLIPTDGTSPFYGYSRPADTLAARSSETVNIRFFADGGVTPVLLPANTTLSLDLKASGKYAGGFVASLTTFSTPTDAATGFYTGTLNTNTTQADSLLDLTQPAMLTLMAQVAWTSPGQATPRRTSKWQVYLDNSVRRGDEGVPVEANPPYPSASDVVAANAKANSAVQPSDLGTAATRNVGTGPGTVAAGRPGYPGLSKIGVFGDSISADGCNVTSSFATLVTAQTGTAPTIINRAVSGTTTADWVNGTNGADLPGAIAAFVAAEVGTVNLMLGTNDSKTAKNITPAAYKTNLQTIIAALFAGVPTLQYVVLNHSPYVNANAYGEWDLTASNALLLQYGQVIDSLDAPSLGIWVGDRFTYYATKANPGLQQDGIHPTGTTGSVAQAQLWLNGYNQRVAPWTFPILDAGQATRLNAAGNALEAWTPYVLSSTQPLLFGSGPTAVQIFGGRTAYTVEMRNVDDTGFVALLAYRLTTTENVEAGGDFIRKSPDGTRYKILVANGGALSTSPA